MKTHIPIRDTKNNEIVAYIIRDWDTMPCDDKSSGLLYKHLIDVAATIGLLFPQHHRAFRPVKVAEAETIMVICDIPCYLIVPTDDSLTLEPTNL